MVVFPFFKIESASLLTELVPFPSTKRRSVATKLPVFPEPTVAKKPRTDSP